MIAQTPTAPSPPALPVLPVPAQAGDLASLQVQVAELRVQLSGLQAQWNGLYAQLNRMLQTNPARPGVQQQWADVGVQIAKVEGDIARLETRITQLGGRPGSLQRPGRFPDNFNPNVAVPAVTLVTLALVLPVSIAWARRLFRAAPRPPAMPHDMAMRLERMEHAVDAIAIEVERVSEGQRFVTKVLAGKPVQASSDNSHTESPLAQQKPPLALGAGPIEPIVVGERERVRQRIVTPH